LPESAFVSSTTIESAKVNSDFSDIAAALTQSLSKDGQTTPTANQPMGGFKHTNVAAASSGTDYARANQVIGSVLDYAADTGSATAYAIAPSPGISAYAVGQRFAFKAGNANTGADPTLAVNSLTAGIVYWPDGTSLAAGDIPADAQIVVQVASVSAGTPTFHLQTVASPISGTVLTTRGDIITRGASAPQRLAVGTAGQVLTTDGTDVSWGSPPWVTGNWRFTHTTTAAAGWIMWTDGTIGDASSNATVRDNADTEDLFTLYWANDKLQLYTSTGDTTTRGADAATDWAAHCAIALPPGPGRVPVIAGSGSDLTARVNADKGGTETNTAGITLPNNGTLFQGNGGDSRTVGPGNYTTASFSIMQPWTASNAEIKL
jgi:hypothetical protein